MSKKKLSKLLALYLPYVLMGLVATNFGEAWRLAVGKELGDKITIGAASIRFCQPKSGIYPFSDCTKRRQRKFCTAFFLMKPLLMAPFFYWFFPCKKSRSVA